MYQFMIDNGIDPDAPGVMLRPVVPAGCGIDIQGIPDTQLGKLLRTMVRLIIMSIQSGEEACIMEMSAEGMKMYMERRNAALTAA